MSDAALGLFVIFAIFALWELERTRKDTARMRVMMEMEQSTYRAACKEISSMSRMLEKEIIDGRDRRMRETLR